MIVAISGGRQRGLRRVNLNRDLGAIASLIEVCFASHMDASGRSTIHEMRALSRLGPLLRLLALMDDMVRGIGQGFVWEEDGQIVGNVTLFPARVPVELGRTTIIANVAVHPDYRRRGIARRLMEASLEAIAAGGGAAAILQVEEDNAGAVRLYQNLGFRIERTWHQWRRAGQAPPPPRLPGGPRLTLRPGRGWREEYALAALVFPPERGGLGWQRPYHPREFRRSPGGHLLDLLSGTSLTRWCVYEEGQLAGSLWARTSLASSTTRLTLLVHPAWAGRLEVPLLNYGARQLALGYRSLFCEHPADDQAATAAFQRYDFRASRTLHHMRLDW